MEVDLTGDGHVAVLRAIGSSSIPWGFSNDTWSNKATSARITWRFNNKVRSMPAGKILRIETLAPAVVHWSVDDWRTVHDSATRDTTLGVHVADLETLKLCVGNRMELTFYWPDVNRWEGVDFVVCVE